MLRHAQLLCDAMDCSPPGLSVHGIFQARILEWFAISYSRGSSRGRDWTQVSCTAGRFISDWATRDEEIDLSDKNTKGNEIVEINKTINGTKQEVPWMTCYGFWIFMELLPGFQHQLIMSTAHCHTELLLMIKVDHVCKTPSVGPAKSQVSTKGCLVIVPCQSFAWYRKICQDSIGCGQKESMRANCHLMCSWKEREALRPEAFHKHL